MKNTLTWSYGIKHILSMILVGIFCIAYIASAGSTLKSHYQRDSKGELSIIDNLLIILTHSIHLDKDADAEEDSEIEIEIESDYILQEAQHRVRLISSYKAMISEQFWNYNRNLTYQYLDIKSPPPEQRI